jgi:circadian clock protein KaiB
VNAETVHDVNADAATVAEEPSDEIDRERDGAVFYELTLFVSGASDLAGRAIANATRLCEANFPGQYHLSVVDVHEDPKSLLTHNLLATPTLVKINPPPVRRVVGDLSQVDKVISLLDLPDRGLPKVLG